jgi:hypothetical protein
MTFNKKYFILFLILLAIEIMIAVFMHDNFIRNNIGDILVVIMLYTLLRAFIPTTVVKALAGVLFFSIFVEVLQCFDTVHVLHLEHNRVASTILGSYFSWMDIACYIAGVAIIYFVERKKR